MDPEKIEGVFLFMHLWKGVKDLKSWEERRDSFIGEHHLPLVFKRPTEVTAVLYDDEDTLCVRFGVSLVKQQG